MRVWGRRKNQVLKKGLWLLGLLGFSGSALGAGFQVQEQNASHLGLAYSGTAALAEDASTAFYNAAGLTKIKNRQLVVAGVLIRASSELDVFSARPSLSMTPLSGELSDDPGGVIPVPSIHYAHPLSDKCVFGLSIASPFGLKTDYDQHGVARYVATLSELVVIDISPSIAYQIMPKWSVALGVDIENAQAQLNARIGDGTLGLDGYQRNNGEDWGWGLHFGMLWDISENTRLGVSYRSVVKIEAEGESEQLVTNSPVAFLLFGPLAGRYSERTVRTQVHLPESLVISGYHRFNDCWAMTFDWHWTKWERFKYLKLRFDPPAVTSSPTDTFENFKNTMRIALGFMYQYNDKLTFKFGAAHDESPVQDETRTARVPDSNRYWVSAGLAYTVNPKLRFDFGYSHLFFKDSTILDRGPNRAFTETPASLALLEGEYKSSADILGVQVRLDFV